VFRPLTRTRGRRAAWGLALTLMALASLACNTIMGTPRIFPTQGPPTATTGYTPFPNGTPASPTVEPVIGTATAIFSTLTPGAATAEASGATVTPLPVTGNYQAQSGDTVTALALRFRIDIGTLLLANPSLPLTQTIAPGTWLNVDTAMVPVGAYTTRLLPDAEVVYSPSAANFDVQGYVLSQPGYLASYTEVLTTTRPPVPGWKLVADYSRRYSLNPRLLLALLELQTGALSNPNADTYIREHALGVDAPSLAPGLSHQLGWAGNQLNFGFYSWQLGTEVKFSLADGARREADGRLNPGSFAVARLLGLLYRTEGFERNTAGDGLLSVYQRLFGQAPPDEPLIPGGLEQPEMQLPFEPGRRWGYTGGPHAAYGLTQPWAALDFAPPAEQPGCVQSPEWEVAVRDGVVVLSEEGMVELDVGGGWTVVYLHVETLDRAPLGAVLKRGEHIGHPSCEGGRSTASHLHISRRYKGVWIQADGFAPFTLSGWTAHSLGTAYRGTLTKGDAIIASCACGIASTRIWLEP
jgi:LasA protease